MAGGHTETVFYVGDGTKLWRWPRKDKSKVQQWQQIVPGRSATSAMCFFVNPYAADEIYILDRTIVRRSADGGKFWAGNGKLDGALTEGGIFSRNCGGDANCVMNDIIFDRNSGGKVRFAMGLAGVFYSSDGGLKWQRLVDTHALPAVPLSAAFDPVSNPNDRSLYTTFRGRGIMRYHPIP